MRKLMLITPLVTLGCLLQAAVPVPAADEILPFKKENDVSPNLDVHRREYASLARVITTPYTLRGVDAPPQTNTPTVAAIVEQLKGANYKPVQLAVKRLDTMLKDAQTSIEAFQAESRQSRAALGEILGGALRGEYTHQVTRPITAPNGRLDFVQETVDDGAMVALESTLLAGATQAGRQQQLESDITRNFELARVDAWKKLVIDLNSLYNSKVTQNSILAFEIKPPEATGSRQAQFAIYNRSGQDLSRVTLVLEMTHFTTAPEVTSYEALFIPQWKAESAIELAPTLTRNCAVSEGLQKRPLEARREIQKKPWLANAAGLSEIRAAVWSITLCQAPVVTRFEKQAEDGARLELTSIAKILFRTYLTETKKNPQYRMEQLPEWCNLAALRARKLAANNQQIVSQADLALKNPHEFIDQVAKQSDQRAHEMLAPGKAYLGRWKIVTGASHIIHQRPLTREGNRLLNEHSGNKGVVALKIEAHNTKTGTILATLFDPQEPTVHKTYQGKLLTNNHNDQLLSLESRETKVLAADLSPDSFRLLSAPGSLNLYLDDQTLSGSQTHPSQRANFQFSVYFTSNESESLRKALEKLQATAPITGSPDSDIMNNIGKILQAGRKFQGNWKFIVGKDVATIPMLKYSAKLINSLKDTSGPISMTIVDFQPDTQEIKVEFQVPAAKAAGLPAGRRPPGMRNNPPAEQPNTRLWNGSVRIAAESHQWSIHLPSARELKQQPEIGFGGPYMGFNSGELNIVSTRGRIDLDWSGDNLVGKLYPVGGGDAIWIDLTFKIPSPQSK